MICIKNGTIHTAVDPQPFTGDILIGGGKILKIASHIDDDYEQLIEAAGLNIYPGFVEAHCHTGLDGYGNGVPGQDTNEWNDPVVPQLRAIDGINPMDPCFEMAAKAGITCFATGPGSSDAIGGTFAAVKPMGKRIDNMILKYPIAMKCAFGENPKRRYMTSRMSTRMTNAALIREALQKAALYMVKKEAAGDDVSKLPAFDQKSESLIPVLKGELPLKAHAHQANDIFTAIRIAKEFHAKLTLEHVTEGKLNADKLGQSGVYMAVGPFYNSSSKLEYKNVDPATAGILSKAGCHVCLITDAPVVPLQGLPVFAGMAIQAGMDSFEALKAITINAAEHLGLQDRVGSLEEGKDADIVITEGSPLTLEGKVKYVLIDGRIVVEK